MRGEPMIYFIVELRDDGHLGRVMGPLKKGECRRIASQSARCLEVEMEDGGTVEAEEVRLKCSGKAHITVHAGAA